MITAAQVKQVIEDDPVFLKVLLGDYAVYGCIVDLPELQLYPPSKSIVFF